LLVPEEYFLEFGQKTAIDSILNPRNNLSLEELKLGLIDLDKDSKTLMKTGLLQS
jgi:hypothetical protein